MHKYAPTFVFPQNRVGFHKEATRIIDSWSSLVRLRWSEHIDSMWLIALWFTQVIGAPERQQQSTRWEVRYSPCLSGLPLILHNTSSIMDLLPVVQPSSGGGPNHTWGIIEKCPPSFSAGPVPLKLSRAPRMGLVAEKLPNVSHSTYLSFRAQKTGQHLAG